MIWALLLLLGVPLWLCAMGLGVIVFRSRALRHRPGNIPVRVLRRGHTRWTRGHGVWVANVFAWRASPAAWTEDLTLTESIQVRTATSSERRPLRRLGDDPTVAVLTSPDGQTLTVATAALNQRVLQGPFSGDPVT